MVEVLERREPPGEQAYVVTCRNCKSRLTFKRSEAEYVSDQRDGDALKISCPVCRFAIWTTPRR